MQIDFSKQLFALDGVTVLKEPTLTGDNSGAPLTLRSVATNSLLMREEKTTGEEYYKRYKLAGRIQESKGPIDLKAEEITLIKSLIPVGYNPIVIGRAYDLLDPPTTQG